MKCVTKKNRPKTTTPLLSLKNAFFYSVIRLFVKNLSNFDEKKEVIK